MSISIEERAELRGLAMALAHAMPPSRCAKCGAEFSNRVRQLDGWIIEPVFDPITIKTMAILMAAMMPDGVCERCELEVEGHG
jgi:hypothetical protein